MIIDDDDDYRWWWLQMMLMIIDDDDDYRWWWLYMVMIIWVNFPRTGKMGKMWHLYFFWSSAVTKRFDFFFNFSQLHSKNVFVWLLANLEPKLELNILTWEELLLSQTDDDNILIRPDNWLALSIAQILHNFIVMTGQIFRVQYITQ